jgi:hypothetical protein
VADAVRLNRLRRAVEHWTDTLVGRLAAHTPELTEYAVDRIHAEQFAAESRQFCYGKYQRTTTWLMNAAMTDTLRRRSTDHCSLPQANNAVASSVIMMLRPDLFDSVGTLKSLWMHRIGSTTGRADRVLQELQGNDIEKAATAEALEVTGEIQLGRWYH